GGIAVLLPQRLLVDLSDTRFGELIHKKNSVGYGEFRDHALVRVDLGMRLDLVFGRLSARLCVADDDRQWAFSPFLVLDADHGHFGDGLVLRNEVLKLE